MPYLQLEHGRKLYYEEVGAGRPVVFIHGWKASADVYAEPSRLLTQAGNYRCIRYDHCGHKRSDSPDTPATLQTLAQDLHSLITALQLEKPILVGWSMGGMTVQEYIRHYGSCHLDRVVFVDIGPRSLGGDDWPLGKNGGTYSHADLEEEYALAKADFKGFLHGYYLRSQRGYAERSPENQQQIVEQRTRDYDLRVMADLWYAFNLRDHRDVLPKIACPTAVFHAEILPSCSAAVADYYDKHITAPHRVVCFTGCSHALITEDPQRFTVELLDFFNS